LQTACRHLTGIQVGVNIAAAFALSFPFAYCYFLSGNVLPCALLHVLIDNFLIFVFEANHGLILSGDFMVFQTIGFFALIPVFIWQFNRMEMPWLLKDMERPYKPAESTERHVATTNACHVSTYQPLPVLKAVLSRFTIL